MLGDIPSKQRALDDLRGTLSGYRSKMLFWYRSAYLSVFAIVLLAVFAFAVRLAGETWLLPAIMSGFMLLAFAFLVLSLKRWHLWEREVDLLAQFMRPMEKELALTQNVQDEECNDLGAEHPLRDECS